MARVRILAIAVLAVVAVVAGFVALAIGSGGDPTSPAAAPSPLPTPTDVTAGVDAGAGVVVSVGRLEQDGIARSYLVLAPTTVPPSTPLILALHGRNATPGDEAARDGLLPSVAAGEAVLVYPVGYEQAWNDDDGCCGLAVALELDDVAFVGLVADAVRERFGLTGPTDLIGFSNGGRLVYDAVCRDAARYTAVATVSAAPPTVPCAQADVPVPLFAGFVLDDSELPTHDDPQPVPTVQAAVERAWTARNGCVGVPDTATTGRATVRTWTDCESGTLVETVSWPTGGHTWPQLSDVGSPDATDLLWSFLSGVHQRAGLAAQ